MLRTKYMRKICVVNGKLILQQPHYNIFKFPIKYKVNFAYSNASNTYVYPIPYPHTDMTLNVSEVY